MLVGEMRDIDSIQIALTMAETGHLVFATLHTNDAPQAIDRIIDVFPAWRQEQTRVQLAASLSAVIAQRLIPKIGGGMVAAFEVLIATNPIRNLIREGRSNQLMNVMFTSAKEGMQTLETSLAQLVISGTITYEDAMAISAHPKELIRTSSRWKRAPLRSRHRYEPPARSRVAVLRRRGSDARRRELAGGERQVARRHIRTRDTQDLPITPRSSEEHPSFSAIVLNAPIGYLDTAGSGVRRCDRDARALLGNRAMTVHNAPTRDVLEGRVNWTEGQLDAVTATLLPSYREVAEEISAFRQRVVYQGHPELSFFQINADNPLRRPSASRWVEMSAVQSSN